MNFELSLEPPTQETTIQVNVTAKASKSDDQQGCGKSGMYQIYARKGHTAIICFNHINLTKYPPTHSRELSTSGPIGMKTPSTNYVASNRAVKVWYPNSGATQHITSSIVNLQESSPYLGRTPVMTSNGKCMKISQSRKSIENCQGSEFKLDEILVVPDAIKNLISIKRLCSDNHVFVDFDKQTIKVIYLESKKILSEGVVEDDL